MPYGIIASASAQLRVEVADEASGGTAGQAAGRTLGGTAGATASDLALDRFRATGDAAWVPGRAVLTRLHLNFVPHRPGRGTASVEMDLRDLVVLDGSGDTGGTGADGGRGSTAVELRTATHLVHLRVVGGGGGSWSRQLAELVAAARRAPDRRL